MVHLERVVSRLKAFPIDPNQMPSAQVQCAEKTERHTGRWKCGLVNMQALTSRR